MPCKIQYHMCSNTDKNELYADVNECLTEKDKNTHTTAKKEKDVIYLK